MGRHEDPELNLKTFIMTAYIALQGSFFFDQTPAVYSSKKCVLAAPKGVKMGTKYKLTIDKVQRTCIVKDRIGKPLGPQHLDLLMGSLPEARIFGRKSVIGIRIK